jgi:hypothetical protein
VGVHGHFHAVMGCQSLGHTSTSFAVINNDPDPRRAIALQLE